jgi:hypothetical protein
VSKREKLTLGDEPVQVLVVGALESEVAAADVINGLVVDHKGAVGMLESGVGGEDGVVWLNDRSRCLRSRVNAELELALLPVVDRQALHQQGAETRARTTAERVEDQEALETTAVIGHMANFVEDLVDQLLTDSVVTTSVVVGSVLLAGNHLLRVEKAAVGAGADLVDDVGLEISVDCAGNIFALAC